MDFGTLVARNATRLADKTAVVSGKTRLTYARLSERAGRVAGALLSLGARPGQRVAILCENRSEYMELSLGCVRCNVVALHVNWRMPAGKVRGILDSHSVDYLFVSDRFSGLFEELRGALPARVQVVNIGGDIKGVPCYENLLAAQSAPFVDVEKNDGDPAMIFFTSGSTGNPKGVKFSHKGMVCHAMSNIVSACWTEDTTYLFATPLFHATAAGALTVLACGGTLVLLDGVHFPEYFETIERERVTRIALIPTLLKRILEYPGLEGYDLSSVRLLAYSSAPMPPELIKQTAKRLDCGFLQSYGMTEMGPVLCVLTPEDHRGVNGDSYVEKLFSVGRPMVDVMVRIVDERGEDCAPGAHGELVVRGYGMMQGYDNLPEATERAIKDGWYYTGDMGYADGEGYIYIASRKSDMIITGGENVYPLEVENCIRALAEDVDDVAVMGFPDEEWGEIVVAFVVRKVGSAIGEERVAAHCREHMESYKKPREVVFIEEIPLNASGKTDKIKIREKYLCGNG
ncbi:AMP-binding protein [Christensenellaceae bacterium OttesenSCG-928-K19]|nr:AMP-binding protein [Christensenellaceae bacterium OttesenSCG-928-K19]